VAAIIGRARSLTAHPGYLREVGEKDENVVSVVKDYLKSCTTYALRRAIRDVVTEGRLYWRHWFAIRKAHRLFVNRPLKLNLGCGPNSKPGWLNIDLFHAGADLQVDLRRRWPFPAGSVAAIYSEHMFEHLEFSEEVPHFLSESLRVLQDKGVFDVGVPDTEWPLRGYGNPEHSYWPFAPTWHPKSCETQLDHINYHFRQGEQHKYAWDEDTLTRSLQQAGFVCVTRRPFDAMLDSESRRIGTLYVRAIKSRTQVAYRANMKTVPDRDGSGSGATSFTKAPTGSSTS
jgi:predicted SAM-dependent methyltransferase